MTRVSRGLDWTLSLSDALAFAFALFTLVHNVVYALNGSLVAVMVAFGASALAVGLLARRFARPLRSSRDVDRGHALSSMFAEPAPLAVVLGAMAVVALLDPSWISEPRLRQNAAIALSLLAAALVWAQARRVRPFARGASAARPTTRADDALVALAMLGGALLSAVVLRPDADDGAYYGHVVYAAEHPFDPLPHFYTVIAPGRAPLPYFSYPLVSLHDLAAAGAAIFGCDPLDVASMVFAPLGGALVVLAYAVAARVLAGDRFRLVFVVALLFLLLDGTAKAAFGDFAFVRIWQGKSLLLNVIAPLILAAAVRFGERPGLFAGARVFALLVASTGVSSFSVWLAPLIAGVGTVAGILASGGSPSTALFVPVLSAYPLLLGAVTVAKSAALRELGLTVPTPDEALLVEPFTKVLGPALEQRIALGASMAAAFIAPTRRLRAVAAVACFIVLGVLTHQAIGPVFARHVTTPMIYWRVLWVLPLPILLGGAAAWADAIPRGLWRGVGWVATSLLAVALLVAVPSHTTLSLANGTHFVFRPHAQLVPGDDAVVRAIVERSRADATVVAPLPLGWALSVRRGAPRALLPRSNMTPIVAWADWGGAAEANLRYYVFWYATGRRPFRIGPLSAVASRRDVQGFIVSPTAAGRERLDELLRANGFGPREQLGRYFAWWRPASGLEVVGGRQP